jgi:putative colanic acid biosysnthesis UDP-glucose lipid carrier transferase
MSSVDDIVAKSSSQRSSLSRRPYASVLKLLPGLVLILDSLVLLAVGYLSFRAIVPYSYNSADFYILAIVCNTMLTAMLFFFSGLYQFSDIMNALRSIDRIVIASFTSFMLMLAAAFTIKISETYSRVWVGSYLVSGTLAIIFARWLVSYVLGRLSERSIIARNVAIIGSGEQVDELLSFTKREKRTFVNVVGVFGGVTHDTDTNEGSLNDEVRRLMDFVRSDSVDDVIVALPWAQTGEISRVMEQLRELPVNVFLATDLVGFRLPMRTPPNYFESMPVYLVSGKPLTGWDLVIKGIEDYVLSLLLLIVLSPLLLLVALLVKLDSPGPVIFKQKRLGFNNKEFNIYKFRSMTYSPNSESKTVQAVKHDPRVTRIGRILRKTSIDEIPQLFNVLNGTMSIVGPRPHAIDHNEEYSKKIRGYFSRHRVKPGLTGLAQVKGFRGQTDTVEKMENRVKYDVEYADNWSLLLDLKIIVQTPLAVIAATNAH